MPYYYKYTHFKGKYLYEPIDFLMLNLIQLKCPPFAAFLQVHAFQGQPFS